MNQFQYSKYKQDSAANKGGKKRRNKKAKQSAKEKGKTGNKTAYNFNDTGGQYGDSDFMDTVGKSDKKGIGRNGKGNEEGFGQSGRRRHKRPLFFLMHYIPKKKHGAWQEGNKDNPMKYEYLSPVGRLCIQTDGEYITGLGIDYETETAAGTPPEIVIKLKKELDEYFAGKRKHFTVKSKTNGTPFQEKVWAALRTIPYGEVRSYKDIAIQIGNERACRAVGGANNKNPLLLLNPCHRVVGADKSLVGFACGVEIKEKLLLLESANGGEDGTEII